MYLQTANHRMELPEGMRNRLKAFQRRMWIVKLAEGLLAGLFGLVLSYLAVFALDRVWDTPAWLRMAILVGGAAGLAILFPLKWHRWVWSTRQMEQVARILCHRFPRLGDQLLGIIELVHNELEQGRSEALCRAAIHQVDVRFRDRDLTTAVPDPRHRRWAWAAGAVAAIAVALLFLVPAAGRNALARWMMPWRDTPRYTFAQIGDLPEQLVVPYAEPFSVTATVAEQSPWKPGQATARFGAKGEVAAELHDGQYAFQLPPQREADVLRVTVGDARHETQLRPTTRPELTELTARVRLPDYLERSQQLVKDIRGGWGSFLKTSQVVFEATATRTLAEGWMDDQTVPVAEARLTTPPLDVLESSEHELSWQDHLGLSAKQPFRVSIHAVDDAPPSLACTQLSREQVLLVDDLLKFQVLATDDFGVKSLGLEWQGIEDPLRNPHPARGEKIVAAGGPEQTDLDALVTFSAALENVPPQSLEIRLFVVDYLPDRPRVFSPSFVVHVLSPEEHAIWMTNQMRKWFRQAQDVYEREQQLFQTNLEIRDLPTDQLDRPETRRRIETQAAAERANAGRLDAVASAGEELIRQAVRNDQFNVATMEQWAAMLKALEAIAQKRMPSVAELLDNAATAPGGKPGEQPARASPDAAAEAAAEETPPSVGENRDGRSGKAVKSKPDEPSKVPSIGDIESGFNDLDQDTGEPPPGKSPPGRLSLPGTAILGGGPPQEPGDQTCPAQQEMDQAVALQEDLLDEFAKVADELQKILGNLEGSSFVKRLKAASRRQLEIAGELNGQLSGNFGVPDDLIEPSSQAQAERIAEREIAESDQVYILQEDLEAFYNRVQQGKFQTVLREMQDDRVVGQLRSVADTVQNNLGGQSIAQAEFWADALDRWAEQLVGPG